MDLQEEMQVFQESAEEVVEEPAESEVMAAVQQLAAAVAVLAVPAQTDLEQHLAEEEVLAEQPLLPFLVGHQERSMHVLQIRFSNTVIARGHLR